MEKIRIKKRIISNKNWIRWRKTKLKNIKNTFINIIPDNSNISS